MPDFVLLGEPLALELANTVVVAAGGDAPADLLAGDADTAAWVRAHAAQLPAGAGDDPPSARRLRRLRDAVRELIDATLTARAPDAAALALVNRTAAAAPLRTALTWDAGGPPRATQTTAPAHQQDATLAAVARSAIELLGGPDRARLRRCEGPGCLLVFVAANPRRRWCSPELCGNRVRVARHYDRHARAKRD